MKGFGPESQVPERKTTARTSISRNNPDDTPFPKIDPAGFIEGTARK